MGTLPAVKIRRLLGFCIQANHLHDSLQPELMYMRKQGDYFMGAWSESITGNDTAEDLLLEYPAAFLKYEPEEAVSKIDQYVRENEFDESDPEEWCNYVYSLADYMWKKGILTDEIRERALKMIDSGFGLDIWAESGEKMLKARKRALAKFREKLTSPLPPKKKIRLDINQERIFENGDVIAIQLKTAGMNYTMNRKKPMSEEEFHAFDGKYILMQLIDCTASWSSAIVPEIKDYWACFRLFDGVYDTVPKEINFDELKPAKILDNKGGIVSCFTCESKMLYFKRRKYQLIGNAPITAGSDEKSDTLIFIGHSYPQNNPDSEFLAAMGNEIVCGEYNGTDEELREICRSANRYGRNLHLLNLSKEEQERHFTEEENKIASNIESSVSNGGKLLSVQFGNKTIGIATITGSRIDNLYIRGLFQGKGFGRQLLRYALSLGGEKMHLDVPNTFRERFGNKTMIRSRRLMRLCQKFELTEKQEELGEITRFTFLPAPASKQSL